jgi:hypothetical protein
MTFHLIVIKKIMCGEVLWDKTTHKKPCGYVGTWEVYKPVIDFYFWEKKPKFLWVSIE